LELLLIDAYYIVCMVERGDTTKGVEDRLVRDLHLIFFDKD